MQSPILDAVTTTPSLCGNWMDLWACCMNHNINPCMESHIEPFHSSFHFHFIILLPFHFNSSHLFLSPHCRTRYGTVVSVVDLSHYLISVTFVSPFQHKSPKSKSGDSKSHGPSSCCVCLYLSVDDFNFVDWDWSPLECSSLHLLRNRFTCHFVFSFFLCSCFYNNSIWLLINFIPFTCISFLKSVMVDICIRFERWSMVLEGMMVITRWVLWEE